MWDALPPTGKPIQKGAGVELGISSRAPVKAKVSASEAKDSSNCLFGGCFPISFGFRRPPRAFFDENRFFRAHVFIFGFQLWICQKLRLFVKNWDSWKIRERESKNPNRWPLKRCGPRSFMPQESYAPGVLRPRSFTPLESYALNWWCCPLKGASTD